MYSYFGQGARLSRIELSIACKFSDGKACPVDHVCYLDFGSFQQVIRASGKGERVLCSVVLIGFGACLYGLSASRILLLSVQARCFHVIAAPG